MANTKTAKENILINERNRKRNAHNKTRLKSAIKDALTAINDKAENKADVVKATLRTIDKSVTKGIIHKNKAARKKSAISKLNNAA